jgi:DNA-binding NarL/FixJ family response regulator
MTTTPVRVLLADDHPIVLAGLKALIDASQEFEVVGEAQDGRAALSLAKELRPDVLILDVSMPELSGLEVATALAGERPECRVLVLTVHEDSAYLRQLVRTGVSGYLLKRSASDELIRALRAVVSGGMYLDPAIAGKAVGGGAKGSLHPEHRTVELSERETEVLRLVARGHSNKEISAQLNIGVKTVETYKMRAMDKLGYRSRANLVRYAAGKGWLGEQ